MIDCIISRRFFFYILDYGLREIEKKMNPSILILLIVFGTSISLAHKTPEKNEATNPLDLDQSRLTSRKFFKDHNEEIVCYSPYGCFTKNEVDNKFTIGKILARFPEDPRKLGVQYYFFSCKDYFNPTVLPWTLNESDLIRNLNYNPKFQTIILVHGYTERFNQLDWTGDLKDTVLNRDSCRWNVIGVEYGRAVQSPYAQAIANAKLVGAMIAYLIRQLNLAFNTTNNDFVLVGHSLGCHTAGFAGKKLTDPKLRMILASEPAGPAFNRVSNSERLSPTDADLVLTVQTNQGSSFLQGSGVKDPLGHYSFLVNDASAQPGCQVINRMGNLFTDGLINGLYAIGGCSHARSIELIIAYAYEDSRNDFQVMAYRCPRYQDYDEGRCSRCDSSLDCVRFGHWFEYWLERKKPPVNSNATRIYRMNTRKSMPYSLHAYGFEVNFVFFSLCEIANSRSIFSNTLPRPPL